MAVAPLIDGVLIFEIAPEDDPPFGRAVAEPPAPVAVAVRVPARLNNPVFCPPVI